MEQVLSYLNNYFYRFAEAGEYSINSNRITIRGQYAAGQYIRVCNSIMNDGVWKVLSVGSNTITLENNMIDEIFVGTIYSLGVPVDVIKIKEKKDIFEKRNDNNKIEVSEKFAEYSSQKATTKEGSIVRWYDVYKQELKKYRKMSDNRYLVKRI